MSETWKQFKTESDKMAASHVVAREQLKSVLCALQWPAVSILALYRLCILLTKCLILFWGTSLDPAAGAHFPVLCGRLSEDALLSQRLDPKAAVLGSGLNVTPATQGAWCLAIGVADASGSPSPDVATYCHPLRPKPRTYGIATDIVNSLQYPWYSRWVRYLWSAVSLDKKCSQRWTRCVFPLEDNELKANISLFDRRPKF